MAGRRRSAGAGAPIPALISEVLRRHPLAAVDVGAARGVPAHWSRYIDVMRVHAFEPRADECARLAARSHPNIRWHPVSLAGEAGRRQLHVLAGPTGSSLFPPDDQFARLYGEPGYIRVAEVVDVECTTLGAHLDTVDEAGPVLIKLDTQGTELEILQGLSDTQFADVLAVEVETEFHTAYRGQPCFPEMHAFMTGQGFELFDMRTQRVFLTGGQEANHYIKTFLGTAVGTRQLSAKLHAADAFYIRPFTSMVDTMTLEQFGHYATILQMYRAYDVIFWLLDQPRMRDLLGVQGHFEVVSAYVAAAPRPRFIERSGPLPLALRRGRRAASLAVERLIGGEGFSPPRTFWTHTYWPDQ